MIIVANWKLNLTLDEVKSWVAVFNSFAITYPFNNTTPVICPSPIYIPYLKGNLIKAKIGAQDVSKFSEGSYTGEVSARQLKEYVSYSIIGHSERREHFFETDGIVAGKAKMCLDNNITPIVCVSDVGQADVLKGMKGIIIAFEPLSAIGSGTSASVERIESEFAKLTKRVPKADVLYGGSVSDKDARDIAAIKGIGGLLVGGESLNPHHFIDIIKKCDM